MDSNLTQRIKKLVQLIEMTEETECDCSHVYDLMDEVAEAVAAGQDLSEAMPTINQHLEMCGCCRAELTALRRVLDSAEKP